MVGWQRQMQSVLLQVGRRLEHNYTVCQLFFFSRELPSILRVWRSPSASISMPLYKYFPQLGISTSRKLLASSSEETPIPSPLTPVLAINSGKTEEKKVVPTCSKVQAVLKKTKELRHMTIFEESFLSWEKAKWN